MEKGGCASRESHWKEMPFRNRRTLQKLKKKRIKGAGIDVFGVEPLPGESEFRKLDNVILTPHTGYFTERSYQIFHDQMVENILAWHNGEPIRQLT